MRKEVAADRDDSEPLRETPGSLPWLLEIMSALLGPNGCPWDREQTLQSLRPYLIEECYEVLDAIDQGDPEQHCEELGDLLLQIVFQSQLAQIGMQRIVESIGQKLIRRHPHVFGDLHVRDSAEVVDNWEAIKATEKAQRGEQPGQSLADRVPRALPALQRTHEITRKAQKIGFQVADPEAARDQLARLQALTDSPSASEASGHEIAGELLLQIASIATGLGVEPEQALRDALRHHEARLRAFERAGRD